MRLASIKMNNKKVGAIVVGRGVVGMGLKEKVNWKNAKLLQWTK
jgi:ribosomal protein L7/L12